jgi:hypothetical protein
MLSMVTLPRGGRWAGRMAGGVGWPQAQPRPCLAGFCWLGWRRHAWSAQRGQIVLRCRSGGHAELSHRARRTILAVLVDSERTDAPARLSCGTGDRAGLSYVGHQTVLCQPMDCLDSLTGHPQDCLAIPSPDCLAVAAARLDSGRGDCVLGRRRQWSVKVRMWDE